MSVLGALRHCAIGPGIEFVSLTKELTRFRQRLETEADGVPLHLLTFNAAELLSDLCVFLQLGERQHDEVLGAHNVAYIKSVHSVAVEPTVRH